MNGKDSAKQYLPYAALKGYDDAVHEMDGCSCSMRLWGQDRAEELDTQLRDVSKGDRVRIVSYRNGGEYTTTGYVTELDLFGRALKIGSDRIPFNCIYSIEKI